MRAVSDHYGAGPHSLRSDAGQRNRDIPVSIYTAGRSAHSIAEYAPEIYAVFFNSERDHASESKGTSTGGGRTAGEQYE